MERVWLSRLRWRMRGAWLWPAFGGFALIDAVLLHALPATGEGLGLVAGLLVAGFLNLAAVAVLAPLLGRLLRRRRADLPRVVADDYAGSALVLAIGGALLAGGLIHRPAVLEAQRDLRAEALAVHGYVVSQAPAAYRANVLATTTLKLQPDLYRSCVPGNRPNRPLCLYVDTAQDPPGVTLDTSREPNETYAVPGAFGGG